MGNEEQQPALPQQAAGADQLPSFWPEDLTSWCRITEGQFTLRNVDDPVPRKLALSPTLS